MSAAESPRPKIFRPHKEYRLWSLTTDVLAPAIEAKRGRSGKPGLSSGSAYVFTYSDSAWAQQAKLLAADSGATSPLFGDSVSLSANGSTALIGSYWDDDWGTNSGSAYVFIRRDTTWSQQAKLLAGDGATGDKFGHGVSLSADGPKALIGAYDDDDNGTNSGSAFGSSVSVSADGSNALIGAVGDDDRGLNSGSAYVLPVD
jgi:hypothetical protein